MAKFINIDTKTQVIELVTNGVKEFDNILLCFHGFGGDRYGDGFSKMKKCFDNVLVCAFDSAGHGESKIESIDMRIDLILKEIEVVVDFLKKTYNKPISILASSYGAYRVMLYLLKFNPKNIKNVVLINPAFNMLGVLEKVKGFKYQELKEDDIVPMKKSLNKFLSKAFIDDLYQNDLYSLSKPLNNDLNIVIGLKDDLISLSDTLEYTKKYNAKVTYIDDGHYLAKDSSWDAIKDLINNNL